MSNIILAFPLFSIIVCFIGAVCCSFTNKKVSFYIVLSVCLLVTALSVVTFAYCLDKNESFIYTMGHFDPTEDGIRICNEIRFGTVETFLASVFPVILFFILIGGKQMQDQDIPSHKMNLYYVMMCLILVSFIALTYTNDIFTGFVFLEISTLVSCGCWMVKEKGSTILSTVRYMIFNLVGSGLFLIGFVTLYDVTGYLSIENIASKLLEMEALSFPAMLGMTLVVIGLSIKSGLFPFHYWMPDAYGNATPASSSVMSGIATKGYVILLIKVIYRMFTIELVRQTPILTILFILGVLGMVVASINAINQKSVDRMVSFSSAAQIGYIFMGIGISENIALIAAIVHILTHSITKPLLFLTAGHLSRTSDGSLKFRNLRGVGRVAYFNGFAFSLGCLSMVGVPLLAGFSSKYLFISSAVTEGVPVWMMIVSLMALAASTVLNAIYFLRTMITIYLPVDKNEKVSKNNFKPNVFTYIGVNGLILLNLLLGLFLSPIVKMLSDGIDKFV